MKKLLFALLLFVTLPLMAQVARVRPKQGGGHSGNNTLTIASPRNQNYRFWVYVDDVLQNQQSVRSICVRNLAEDSYYVRVELDNPPQNCVGQFVDLRQSQTFAVVHVDKWYGLEPSNIHVRPELTISLITEDADPSVILPSPIVHPGSPMPYGMNPNDYEAAYQMVSKESFDKSKLTLAQQVVSANPMSASQILGLCKLFSFESNKLEFAKFAYAYCTDKNKYFLLNEAFTYESSKRELDEYIRKF